MKPLTGWPMTTGLAVMSRLVLGELHVQQPVCAWICLCSSVHVLAAAYSAGCTCAEQQHVRFDPDAVASSNTTPSTAIQYGHIQCLAVRIAPGIANQNLSQRLGTVHGCSVGHVSRPCCQGQYTSLLVAVQGA